MYQRTLSTISRHTVIPFAVDDNELEAIDSGNGRYVFSNNIITIKSGVRWKSRNREQCDNGACWPKSSAVLRSASSGGNKEVLNTPRNTAVGNEKVPCARHFPFG